MTLRKSGRKFLAVMLAGLALLLLAAAAGEEKSNAATDGGALQAAADAPAGAGTAVAAKPSRVALVNIKGGIFLGTGEYIVEAIDRAAREGYNCLVIEMDTPGGALDQTQDIVKAMLGARIPIVVYVTPKGAQAASAGTFITMAGHVAAMAPGSRIGAAHPVMMSYMPSLPGGDDEKDKDKKKKLEKQNEIMNEKVTNDTVSFIVGIAKERGRNADWAEKAVREAVSITAAEAVELKVIDLEADTLDDLLEKIDGRRIKIDSKTTVTLQTRGAIVDRWGKSLKQRLLGSLASPNLLWLLFLLGLGGIAMEFYHPGAIVPGVVGGLCLLLALVSIDVLPVSIGGLLLVLAGIGLFIAEVFVTSYGLLAIGGGVLLVLGGIMLVDPSSQPHYMDPSLGVDWSVLIPTVVVLGLGMVFIGYKVISTQRRKIETGKEGMLGLIGKARSEITPEGGKVFVHGEHWQAKSQETIPEGSQIEVVKIDGLMLHVRKKN